MIDPQRQVATPTTSDASLPSDNQQQAEKIQVPMPVRQRQFMRPITISGLVLLLVLVFSTGFFTGCVLGSRSALSRQHLTGSTLNTQLTGETDQTVRESIIAHVRPAVVQVNVMLGEGAGFGSGVIIDSQGYIVTNNHVVNGATSIQVVLVDGQRYTGRLIGTSPVDDLAVIKITPSATTPLVVVPLGDSSTLQIGQDVLAIGNTLGLNLTVSSGIISALGHSVNEGFNGVIIPQAIQIDAPINPGNSGGALVDMQGRLIGIPTLSALDPQFGTPANGVGFAIPVSRVRLIAPQLITLGKVTHTGLVTLGATVESVDSTLATKEHLLVDQGVLIISVTPNGPAAHAGLEHGDVITDVDDMTVADTNNLGDALGSKKPGDTLTVQIQRGEKQLTVHLKLSELPSE